MSVVTGSIFNARLREMTMNKPDKPRFRLTTDAPMILVAGILLIVALATTSRKAFLATVSTAIVSLVAVFLVITLLSS